MDFYALQIKPVHPRGKQPWIFIGRADAEAEAEALILWPHNVKSWLIGQDPDAGKDWRQEEKGATEDEMVGWHHRLNGHGFGWTPGVGDGQGGLACCSPWGHKVSDTTEWLNWTLITENTLLSTCLFFSTCSLILSTPLLVCFLLCVTHRSFNNVGFPNGAGVTLARISADPSPL